MLDIISRFSRSSKKVRRDRTPQDDERRGRRGRGRSRSAGRRRSGSAASSTSISTSRHRPSTYLAEVSEATRAFTRRRRRSATPNGHGLHNTEEGARARSAGRGRWRGGSGKESPSGRGANELDEQQMSSSCHDLGRVRSRFMQPRPRYPSPSESRKGDPLLASDHSLPSSCDYARPRQRQPSTQKQQPQQQKHQQQQQQQRQQQQPQQQQQQQQEQQNQSSPQEQQNQSSPQEKQHQHQHQQQQQQQQQQKQLQQQWQHQQQQRQRPTQQQQHQQQQQKQPQKKQQQQLQQKIHQQSHQQRHQLQRQQQQQRRQKQQEQKQQQQQRHRPISNKPRRLQLLRPSSSPPRRPLLRTASVASSSGRTSRARDSPTSQEGFLNINSLRLSFASSNDADDADASAKRERDAHEKVLEALQAAGMNLRLSKKLLEGMGPRSVGNGKEDFGGGNGDNDDHDDNDDNDDADSDASRKSFNYYDLDGTYHVAKDTGVGTSNLNNSDEAERGIEEKGANAHPAFSRSENNIMETVVTLSELRPSLVQYHLTCSLPNLLPSSQHGVEINADEEEIMEMGPGAELTFIMSNVPISKKVGSPCSPPNDGDKEGGMEISPDTSSRYPQSAIPPPPPRSTKCERTCSLPYFSPSRQPGMEQPKVHTEDDAGRGSAEEFPKKELQTSFPPPPPKAKYDQTSSRPCSLPSRQPRLRQLNDDNEEDVEMGLAKYPVSTKRALPSVVPPSLIEMEIVRPPSDVPPPSSRKSERVHSFNGEVKWPAMSSETPAKFITPPPPPRRRSEPAGSPLELIADGEGRIEMGLTAEFPCLPDRIRDHIPTKKSLPSVIPLPPIDVEVIQTLPDVPPPSLAIVSINNEVEADMDSAVISVPVNIKCPTPTRGTPCDFAIADPLPQSPKLPENSQKMGIYSQRVREKIDSHMGDSFSMVRALAMELRGDGDEDESDVGRNNKKWITDTEVNSNISQDKAESNGNMTANSRTDLLLSNRLCSAFTEVKQRTAFSNVDGISSLHKEVCSSPALSTSGKQILVESSTPQINQFHRKRQPPSLESCEDILEIQQPPKSSPEHGNTPKILEALEALHELQAVGVDLGISQQKLKHLLSSKDGNDRDESQLQFSNEKGSVEEEASGVDAECRVFTDEGCDVDRDQVNLTITHIGELEGSSRGINNISETTLKIMYNTDQMAFMKEECGEKKNEKNNMDGEDLNSHCADELPSRHHHASDTAEGQEVFPKKESKIAIPPPPRRPCHAKHGVKKFGKDNEDTIAHVVDTSPSTKSIVDLSTQFEEIDTVATLTSDTRPAVEEGGYASLSLSDPNFWIGKMDCDGKIGGSGNISKSPSFLRLPLCTNDKCNHNISPPRRSRKPRNMSLSTVPECSTESKQISSEPKQQPLAKNSHHRERKKQSPQQQRDDKLLVDKKLGAYPSPTSPLDCMPLPQRKRNPLQMPSPPFHPPPPPLHSRKLPFPSKEGPNTNEHAKGNANRPANQPTAKFNKQQRHPPPRRSSNETKSAKFNNSISSSTPPPPPPRRKPGSRNDTVSGTLASGNVRTSNPTSNHSSTKSLTKNTGSFSDATSRRSGSDDRHGESNCRQRRGKSVPSVQQGKKSGNPNISRGSVLYQPLVLPHQQYEQNRFKPGACHYKIPIPSLLAVTRRGGEN